MTEKRPEQNLNTLLKGTQELNLKINVEQHNALLQLIELLIKWNKAFNLTAIRDKQQMLIRHIMDSLSVGPYLKGNSIIDVGSGAGFPGLPLAIVFPKKRFMLLDSNGKKVRFINQAIQNLNLKNVHSAQHRVESYVVDQKFDTVISRAFTSLEQMVNMTGHLIDDTGLIQAMKGATPKTKVLPEPWKISKIIKLQVPELDEQRHLVEIIKEV